MLGEPERPVNLTPFARREVVGDALYEFPPYGPGEPVEGEVTVDGLVLANEHLRATLSPDGTITSLLHAGREALAAPANRLELYEDEPTHWEAWDIDPAHLETGADLPPARVPSRRSDPAARRGRLRPRLDHPDDPARRRLAALSRSPRRSNWQFDRKLLKVAFPLAVRATDVTYEVAFGAVQRPTHYSRRADLARYEVPGHRWADMSEHGFGVAVLTDSKYGYSAFGDTLRISLLRAPRNPDPEADRGQHTVRVRPPPPHRHLAGRGRGRRGGGVQLADPLRHAAPAHWRARPAGSCWTRSSARRTPTR